MRHPVTLAPVRSVFVSWVSNPLKPVKKENIRRVTGSAALKMYDHNYIHLPRAIADHGTPIVINNACSSWHRLATEFTFGNARAYIGTLFPVTGGEAHDVVVKLLDQQFASPLATALWSAQNEVDGDGVRRPYVATGIFPQRVRPMRGDVRRYVARRLSRSLQQWREYLAKAGSGNERSTESVENIVRYYERMLEVFHKSWPDTPTP
jgi:hypothetical protein